MSELRTIRVCCPIHEACFEVEENAKILCEITGHALSSDFPNAEFWEFCCNCETFVPSKLGRGEKARKLCFSCENEVSERFLCTSCKVLSFECGTRAKGRSYFVTPIGIDPVCPGCRAAPESADNIVRHECLDMGAAIYTASETCPFCLEKTSPFFPNVTQSQMVVGGPAGTCPQCRATIVPGSAFCGKCKYQLRGDLPAEKLGTDVTLSQLFGSLCPNCSTPISPGSGFCAECGQAVKAAALPPPPPPPPPPSAAKPAITAPKPPPVGKIFAGVVGGLFFLVLIAVGIRSSIEGGPSAGHSTPSPIPVDSRSPATTTTATTNASINSFPLIENVEQKYSGTIGTRRQKFSIALTRIGTQLTGTAETPKSWDKLVGTIDNDGYFDLKGYERGDMDMNTGDYTGQISSSGTISGRWSNGTTGSDFTASRE
jgi:hypothetical protein